MSEDLDDLLRRAMKNLEDQVPPGYFEDFPRRTLARLEDSTMQDEPHDAVGASRSADSITAAPAKTVAPAPTAAPAAPALGSTSPAKERDEDSGLHDIRSLATSQRMRISSKRSSQDPIVRDQEILATTSGAWKAVALPEPAKMISLPPLSELPPAEEVKEAEASSRRKKQRDSKQKIEAVPEAAAAAAAAKDPARSREAAAAVEPPSATPITAAKAKPKAPQKSSGRSGLIAAISVGLAAAAGAVFVFSSGMLSKKESSAPAAEPAGEGRAGLALPELSRVEQAPAPVIAAPEAAGSAAAVEPPKADPVPEPDKGKAPEKPTKSTGQYVPNVIDEGKPEKPSKKGKVEDTKKPEPGDPDFDKLLKEAGYQDKKPEGPKLEKKNLGGDDIKKGMNGVAGKVQACYAGQQGTAVVKVSVAPTGAIQKVTVTGEFAGTPVGACVEAAVQSATFPPWDGGPHSFNYSYLLAE